MISQKYRMALLSFIFLIFSGRSDSGILESVKFQIIDEATREPLKNCELNICKFLTLKHGAPSPYSDKAAECYITSVVTDENGVFKLDLSLIKEKHITIPLEKCVEKETLRLTNAAAESHKRLEEMRKWDDARQSEVKKATSELAGPLLFSAMVVAVLIIIFLFLGILCC